MSYVMDLLVMASIYSVLFVYLAQVSWWRKMDSVQRLLNISTERGISSARTRRTSSNRRSAFRLIVLKP